MEKPQSDHLSYFEFPAVALQRSIIACWSKHICIDPFDVGMNCVCDVLVCLTESLVLASI